MDIVERLRTNWDFDNDDKLVAADEIERLRQQNAELFDALQKIANREGGDELFEHEEVLNEARAAIAKATGGE